MAKTRISDSDLASVALYDKVNQMISETEDGKTIETGVDGFNRVVGVIEKNKGDVKYDWVGTLEDYVNQQVAELHPEWVCLILDDYEAESYEAYSKEEMNSLLSQEFYTRKETQELLSNVTYTKTQLDELLPTVEYLD